MRKEFAMLVVADSQRAMKKSLDKELVRIIDKASPNMWQLIREAKATAINGSMSNMKKLLRDIGREEKMDKEEKQLQHFACELVHDKISNETMKDNFENKMFACFDSKFNHHKTRVWRLWDNPEQDFEAAKRAGLDLLDAFAEDQLYEEEEERPEGYTPSLYIPPPAADQLRDKFFRLLQPELVWALESKRNSSTHNSLMVAFLLLLLGWDELLWLLTNPLYLLTFLLFAAAAAGYYFTQKIGNLSQIAAMLGLNLPGAAAAAGGGGGGEKGVNLEQFRGMPSGRETGRAGVRSYPGTDKSQ
ncbi:hypothetical protein GUITHDRAFT_114957 [Guillardia theta CCMP2712]|uniref:Sey1/RHD3-like three-helix bundle domain-containing protein n=1 Tax=Guillardia theta (strain CCMP2712) TaxID=905079 RepID=L1ISI4_GUITC|nr:hypothetical protein GUITHDRAFT_114957 [Guillardia theta CCMP2712]EKX38849.1 hypothetical protein GUITHDRAFT_114957 [Guillardia theta CCMP2712]|eukprot:XP_005825829.1 hypothetical protein GUITHDRAFT_114957 [Guillardia theta CCMP2712]